VYVTYFELKGMPNYSWQRKVFISVYGLQSVPKGIILET